MNMYESLLKRGVWGCVCGGGGALGWGFVLNFFLLVVRSNRNFHICKKKKKNFVYGTFFRLGHSFLFIINCITYIHTHTHTHTHTYIYIYIYIYM